MLQCRALAHRLESKQDEEGHHEAKETHGLGESEPHDTVGEQLTLHARVAGVGHHEASKHGSDTSARSGNTNDCCASTDVLGSLIDIALNTTAVERTYLGAEECCQSAGLRERWV